MDETTEAILVRQNGGPEVLRSETMPLGPPQPGEVRLRHTAIGVNFVDVYQRRGGYPIPLPYVPGSEGAGVVEAVGTEVAGFRPGDRAAYADALGAYCARRNIAAVKLVRLPDGIDDLTAAGGMLKGLTAEYLVRRVFPIGAGHTVLLHAAAGGLGLIVSQWASALGATVIGTVGSADKARLARANGCAHTIDYTKEDFVERVRELTHGRGVDAVYDSVGKDTFPGSLDTLRPRGMWVSLGQSSGFVPDFSPLLLSRKGSLFMTRPRLADYVADHAEYETAAAALFAAIADGSVRVTVNQTFPLAAAADAHRALEARRTTGSTVLLP